MASGGSDNKGKGTSYKDEGDKISEFLAAFYYEDEEDMGHKVFPYSDQIEQLALREQVTLLFIINLFMWGFIVYLAHVDTLVS